MLAIFAILSVCAVLQGNLAEPTDPVATNSPVVESSVQRIVNGVTPQRGEIPYQVDLKWINNHLCGGSILNENFVLTAAHCVLNKKPAELNIIAGTTNTQALDNTATTHKVTNIVMHENYEQEKEWNNDIALLEVDPPFKFNQFVKPAKLPKPEQKYPDNTKAVVSGFGYKGLGTSLSPQLLKTTVYTVSQETCRAANKANIIRPTTICAGNIAEKQGFCGGDSGGPLSVDGTVIGIVSWSANGACAPTEKYQVYTRVSSYIPWINSHCHKTSKPVENKVTPAPKPVVPKPAPTNVVVNNVNTIVNKPNHVKVVQKPVPTKKVVIHKKKVVRKRRCPPNFPVLFNNRCHKRRPRIVKKFNRKVIRRMNQL